MSELNNNPNLIRRISKKSCVKKMNNNKKKRIKNRNKIRSNNKSKNLHFEPIEYDNNVYKFIKKNNNHKIENNNFDSTKKLINIYKLSHNPYAQNMRSVLVRSTLSWKSQSKIIGDIYNLDINNGSSVADDLTAQHLYADLLREKMKKNILFYKKKMKYNLF
tara:strand:+ start:1118 stop:1603 length:486 start_codon:yes stop_codon:yes gene_type:complete